MADQQEAAPGTAILWFRRDLRLHDLPALAARVEQTLAVAEAEIAGPDTPAAAAPLPRPGRAHRR